VYQKEKELKPELQYAVMCRAEIMLKLPDLALECHIARSWGKTWDG
jgi:hypothetical protein